MDNISNVILFTVSVWTFLLNLVIGFVLIGKTENMVIFELHPTLHTEKN